MNKFSRGAAGLIAAFAICLAVLPTIAATAQNTLIYFTQGGSALTVASGGTVTIQSGGTLAVSAASGLTIAGVANTGAVRGTAATVSAGEDTANTKSITTGFSTITAKVVQILRSNVPVTGDAVITVSGGTLTVADGATYVLTSGDVINWIAVGS